ncbi:MAG: KOW domain-containing RNA-binding protein [Bacillota bacterium]|nr:KOW domain-containing RNA-binding protein [Bacillota bacterium]
MIPDEMLGRVMMSKKGRDQGKTFVIVKVINEQYVIVADGELRKIEHPKMKNVRHLQFTHLVAEDVLESLQNGEVPANHIIRKNLKRMVAHTESTGKEVW